MTIFGKLVMQASCLAVGAAILSAASAPMVQAATVSESSLGTGAFDVGDTLGTAGDVGSIGTGSLTEFINGQFDTRFSDGAYNDIVDIFKITLDSDSLFSAETLGNPGARVSDPQLFLFNTIGELLLEDDDALPNLQAQITGTLSAGMYFLGITPYDVDPQFDGARILTGWAGVPGAFDSSDADVRNLQYRIGLSADPTAVPTPALLPGLIGFGMSIARKRKQQADSQAEA